MKQITITVPDNCELKQDGNIYTIIEKEKKLIYEDVARKLFKDNPRTFYISRSNSEIMTFDCTCDYNLPNNCTSQKQAEKLLAINKLMNVAKYLNDGWQPDWKNTYEYKWFIYFNNQCKNLDIGSVYSIQEDSIYFKSEELAEQAIEILGEETIKLALCTDY